MKTIMNHLTAIALFVVASAMATASFASETVNFDGCEGKLVPGTNYYNLVDPRCKTISSQYDTTEAEETKKRLAEEASKKD